MPQIPRCGRKFCLNASILRKARPRLWVGWWRIWPAARAVDVATYLLAAYHPELSAASLKATILNTVDVLPAWASYVKTSGRLNVFHALQNPTVCTFTPSIGEIRVPTRGKVFDVTINAAQNCDFSIRPNVNWIKILTSKVASGPTTVTIRVPVNPTISRTGTVTFGDQTLTITQRRN